MAKGQGEPGGPERVDDGAAPAPPTSPAADSLPPGPGATPTPGDASVGLRVAHTRIEAATDEIARRVVGCSGLLDSCGKAAHTALADLEALQDEAHHAQKVLVALRARLLALEQRCHALTHAALAVPAAPEERATLARLEQAAQLQVLHCHQLAERLGAAERSHGPRMQALRHGVEVIAVHADRALRESQQLMVLTRRIGGALESAGRGVDAGPPGAAAR